jgi:hypothetical protein
MTHVCVYSQNRTSRLLRFFWDNRPYGGGSGGGVQMSTVHGTRLNMRGLLTYVSVRSDKRRPRGKCWNGNRCDYLIVNAVRVYNSSGWWALKCIRVYAPMCVYYAIFFCPTDLARVSPLRRWNPIGRVWWDLRKKKKIRPYNNTESDRV